jgi:hypothetical protein
VKELAPSTTPEVFDEPVVEDAPIANRLKEATHLLHLWW